jgi:hypothetical protein
LRIQRRLLDAEAWCPTFRGRHDDGPEVRVDSGVRRRI